MSRKEIVLLVSRALAVVQAVTALSYAASVPEYLYPAIHYGLSASYFGTVHRIEIFVLLIRILGYSMLSRLFWQCGPWVAGLLFPVPEPEAGRAASAE